jgi:hypothetical protein
MEIIEILKICFLKLTNKLSDGTFLQGMAACTAIWFGRKEYKKFRKKQRSTAAVQALVAYQYYFDYIDRISANAWLFQHKDFYPFFIPETSDKTSKPEAYPERPSRLILKECDNLKQKLNEPIAQIAGEDAQKLLTLTNCIEKSSRLLSSSIGAQLGNTTKEIRESTQTNIPACSEELKTIRKQLEKNLNSIIEGKGT